MKRIGLSSEDNAELEQRYQSEVGTYQQEVNAFKQPIKTAQQSYETALAKIQEQNKEIEAQNLAVQKKNIALKRAVSGWFSRLSRAIGWDSTKKSSGRERLREQIKLLIKRIALESRRPMMPKREIIKAALTAYLNSSVSSWK